MDNVLIIHKGIGVLVSAVIFTVVMIVSVAMATQNLVNRVAVIPSSFWLLVLATVFIINMREAGFRSLVLSMLDAFSRRQVLRVSIGSEGRTELGIGFRLLGRDLYPLIIPVQSLVSLYWSAGQASDMAGRDCDDWSVVLWYLHGNAEERAKQERIGLRRPGQHPVIIGPSRPRSVTEALGQQVVQFLSENGVSVSCEGAHAPRAASQAVS